VNSGGVGAKLPFSRDEMDWIFDWAANDERYEVNFPAVKILGLMAYPHELYAGSLFAIFSRFPFFS
jgi:hypothetical protein